MTPTQFKSNDSYHAPLAEYLQTPSGLLLQQMMLETDAALDLPPEVEKQLKHMTAMEMLAYNHACLIGWRAACRFIKDMSNPSSIVQTIRKPDFSTDPRVKEWDDQIAAQKAKLEAQP